MIGEKFSAVFLALLCSCLCGGESLECSFLPWMGANGCPLEYGPADAAVATGCPEFDVELPNATKGPVVDAADFGVSEAVEDNVPLLQKAVAHCRRIGASKLVLKNGTYRFFGTRSVVFEGLKDFTFDANGSTLVFRRPPVWRPDELVWKATFHPEDANLLIRDCERCRFANYAMDWDWTTDPLASFARAVGVGTDERRPEDAYVDFELVDYQRHPCHPEPLRVLGITSMSESRDAFAVSPTGGNSYLFNLTDSGHGRAMEWLSPNRIRVFLGRMPSAPGTHWKPYDEIVMGIASKERIERESKGWISPAWALGVAKKMVVGRLYRIPHYYAGKSGVYMIGNRHLTIENEKVLSCRGMAHVIDGPQHHTQFLHVHVVPPKGRPISSTADSMHVANSLGWLKLVDFRVTLNQDDFSNTHDVTSCGRRTGARTVAVTHLRGAEYFRAEKGDLLELANLDFSPLGFKARITEIKGEEFTLDREVPVDFPETMVFLDRSRGTDHVYWKDCVVERNWGRATMMGNDFTFDNCIFRKGISTSLKIQAAFHPGRWAEGMGATNHVYRGCTFEDTNLFLGKPFGDVAADIFVGTNIRDMDYRADHTKKPWNGAVSRVLFEKCRFVNSRGAIAHFYSGSDIVFRDNDIALGPDEAASCGKYRGSVFVDMADRVRFSGNRLQCAEGGISPGVYFGKRSTTNKQGGR